MELWISLAIFILSITNAIQSFQIRHLENDVEKLKATSGLMIHILSGAESAEEWIDTFKEIVDTIERSEKWEL